MTVHALRTVVLLVAGWMLGCGGAPPPPAPLDLGDRSEVRCEGVRPCWAFDDTTDGWTVTGVRLEQPGRLGVAASGGAVRVSSPVVRAEGPSVLALHLQAGVDLRVLWAPESGGERLLGTWKRPQPWWIGRWHAALIPGGADGRIVLEARGGQAGAPAIVLSFAELLTHGVGRCYRDDYMAVGPPVTVRDAVVCVPPAEAVTRVAAETSSLRITAANGPEGGTGIVEVLAMEAGAASPLLTVTPSEVGRWSAGRTRVAPRTEERLLRVRVRDATGRRGTVAWSLETGMPLAAPRRPNVLLYLVDTLRADGLDLRPGTTRTPTFAALARRGTVFTDVVAPAPWTLPSVVSLFTGLGVAAHGIVSGQDMLRAELVPLAQRFRAAGYRTVAFSTNPYVSTRHQMHRGFESFGRIFAPAGRQGVENGRTAALVNDFAIPWLRDHADEPFFAYLHVMDPHQPYTPMVPPAELAAAVELPENDPRWDLVRFPSRGRGPGGWGEVDRMEPDAARLLVEKSRGVYDVTIAALDRHFARLTAALDELGLSDDTIVVVTADHGEEFLEHGLTGHGHALYGEQLSVPLVIAHPGKVAAGERIDEPVELTGLAATLLGLAGLGGDETSSRMAALLFGRGGASEPEPPVAQLFAPATAGQHLVSEALVTRRWKLIRNTPLARGRPGEPPPAVELYDRLRDPGERLNVADRHPDVVADLAERLDAEGPRTTAPSAPQLDQATRERLRALGYAVD